nr:DC20 [Homo sapiens]
MGRVSGLVPSRFLTLLAHLVVVITLFWSRDSNIQACLPLTFTPEEYDKQDIHPLPLCRLVAALSVTLGPLCSGAGRFPLRSLHVQQHPRASSPLGLTVVHPWPCPSSYSSVGSALRIGTFLSSAVPFQLSLKWLYSSPSLG